MKKYLSSTMLLIVAITAAGLRAEAFDLIEIDLFPSLMGWWIHTHDYGLPVKQNIQVYGNVVDQWCIATTGVVVRIPRTQIDIQIPAGLKFETNESNLPVTHWVAKINFFGEIGPFKLTSIHDMSWSRNKRPDVFFVKEILTYRYAGIRMQGRKIEKDPLPLYLGPTLLKNFTTKHQLQFFLGMNLRENKQKCFEVSYIFIKF